MEQRSNPSLAGAIGGLPAPLSRALRLSFEYQLSLIWVLAVDGFLLLQFLVVPALSYGLTYRPLHEE